MTKPDTPVRRRRIAGERSRPAQRPAPKPSPAPGGPRKPPRPPKPTATGWRPDRSTLAWFVPLCVLALAVAAVAAVLGVRELTDDDPLDAAAREDAVAPAGQSAEALLSFRYDTLDQELESERDLLTDSYADEFRNIFPDQVQEATAQQQATVESRVLAAAPLECGEECSDDSVQVLVFLNTETTVAGEAPKVSPNRAVLTMRQDGGAWRVAGIDLF